MRSAIYKTLECLLRVTSPKFVVITNTKHRAMWRTVVNLIIGVRIPEEFGVHDTVLIKLLARVALFQH